jgi:hypothetical protein
MHEFNISNRAGRDALVNAENVITPLKVRWIDHSGRQVALARILKSTIDRDFEALADRLGGKTNVGPALIEGDPEVDLETVGSFLKNTSRVFINPDRQVVHRIHQFEIVRNPDGSQRERRPKSVVPPNVTEQSPLRWSGRMMDKTVAAHQFVFAAKMQLTHINGLTFDFLYAMAQELEQKNSLMLVGAGPRSNQPLILRRGSIPYRGFLEGRTQGDKYCLLLHLSNQELKSGLAAGADVGGEST